MHGQKRNEYKMKTRDPAVAAKLHAKASQWFQLSERVTSVDQQQQTTPTTAEETLELLSKLVLVNPDPMYLWNRRRELLLLVLPSATATADADDYNGDINATTTANALLQQELTLTQSCLARNPKAYSVWFHRKWIFATYMTSTLALKHEIQLTSNFIQLDERNFHCWNYRKYMVGMYGHVINTPMNGAISSGGDWSWLKYLSDEPATIPMGRQVGVQSNLNVPIVGSNNSNNSITDEQKEQLYTLLESEWDFTSTKITDNFSNGSAIHYRSQLLQYRRHNDNTIQEELDMIHNAIFTDPDDQTAWWYLDYLLPLLSITQCHDEQDVLQQLLEDASESKWVWLGLYNVLSRMDKSEERASTILECLERLIELDPDRQMRYECLKRQALCE